MAALPRLRDFLKANPAVPANDAEYLQLLAAAFAEAPVGTAAWLQGEGANREKTRAQRRRLNTAGEALCSDGEGRRNCSAGVTRSDMKLSSLAASSAGTKERTVFLLGPTGVGKSALGNELTGSESFESTGSMDAVTLLVQFRRAIWGSADRSTEPQVMINVGDSPGLSDTKGRSTKFIDKIMNNIQETRPHGLIFVIQSGRDSHQLQLSMRALAECLGSALSDTRRIVLFVNMLPNDFMFRTETPPIKNPEKQNEKRAEMLVAAGKRVTELLHMELEFGIQTIIGNTHGSWDGVEELQRFIAAMPDEPMDVSRVRTWARVEDDAKRAVDTAEVRNDAAQRRMADLVARVNIIRDNIRYYDESLGVKEGAAGGLVAGCVAAAYATSLFVPGLNLVTTAALTFGTGGVLVAGKAAANRIRRESDQRLASAQKDLDAFMAADEAGRAGTEAARLRRMLEDVEGLRAKIDNVEQAKL